MTLSMRQVYHHRKISPHCFSASGWSAGEHDAGAGALSIPYRTVFSITPVRAGTSTISRGAAASAFGSLSWESPQRRGERWDNWRLCVLCVSAVRLSSAVAPNPAC